VACAAPAIRRQ